MEIIVALGEIYGSERLIPISSAHVSSISHKASGSAGSKFVNSLADKGNQFKVFTTLNPLSVDNIDWRRLGFFEEDFKNQMVTAEVYRRLGGICLYTCTPYFVGNLPKFGDHIAWAESSALIFANSVLGARTNREGGISALAAGLTGRTPFYGHHLYENRKATILIENKANLGSSSDYSALGYYLGNVVGGEVPLITYLGSRPSIEDLKAFSAGIATSGSTALFHMEGITPESFDPKLVSKSNLKDKIIVGDEEIKAVYDRLSIAPQGEIDYVGIGCPHLDIVELEEIAAILAKKKKKVHPNVRLWVYTSSLVKEIADRMGFSRIIMEAGGEIVCNTCMILGYIEKLGFKNFATNSAKAANYAQAMTGLNPFFGSLEDCIDAAFTGQWKGKR
jgi:predicted aconitase